jgi:zinc transport system permease protein
MVVISLLKSQKIDLYAYLFGDILTVTNANLYWIYAGGALVLGLLISNWSKLVLITICQDLARAEGLKIFFMQLLLMFLMAMVVAVSIHIVGILLITSMLIIPAASARQFARSPQAMAIIAAFLGIVAVILGILSSLYFDTPTGPSIVVAAVVIFILTYFKKQ